MSGRRPFKIEIFVAEGRPDGLRLVEKSNWIGQVIVCPRKRYPEVRKERKEFARSGVYLLMGQDGDHVPRVYVGETENVRNRLNLHYVDAEKDFWQQTIVFTTTGTELDKAQVKYLEARLQELARRAEKQKRAKVEAKKKAQRPKLSEADEAVMEGYLDEVRSLLPVLGVDLFEDVEGPAEGRIIYRLHLKGCQATGFETNTGFMVLKGSVARAKALPGMEKGVPGYYRQRRELIEDGVLEETAEGYRFTDDQSFTSPSAAASVCYGGAAAGPTAWKDESGNTLKANREKAIRA